MRAPLALLGDLLGAAKGAGADAADALYIGTTSLVLARRIGRIEHFERSEARQLGLRVFVGKRVAIVATERIDPRAFPAMAERAITMARALPVDPHATLAPPTPAPDAAPLDLIDATEPEPTGLSARAGAAEDAALAIAGITNSEGAEASYTKAEVALMTSAGFQGAYARTNHGLSVVAVAGTGVDMQRDYEFCAAVHQSDLDDAASLGTAAARRALARLGPRRVSTTRVPVVYDARVAGSLLGHFAQAINGLAVARGTSFLKDRLGGVVFSPAITITDDPVRKRGLRSRPFDAEGLASAKRTLVHEGHLESWLLDLTSAHQLGLSSTAHARRSPAGPPQPGPSNLYLAPGPLASNELMADIGEGLFVTELIGSGVNLVTGDYSRGAAGFMIRDGEIAEPVAEITIAGNLSEMFTHLTPANDLHFRRGVDAPTVRIEGMTVAGA